MKIGYANSALHRHRGIGPAHRVEAAQLQLHPNGIASDSVPRRLYQWSTRTRMPSVGVFSCSTESPQERSAILKHG
jgi:hypothetical protein